MCSITERCVCKEKEREGISVYQQPLNGCVCKEKEKKRESISVY